MNRSPLFYPMARGMDAEAGGAADLQTDVMRFMAILSMCLVAIFALVQSIPMAPVPVETPVSHPESPPATIEAPPVAEPDIELVRPAPVRIEAAPVARVALQRPAPAKAGKRVTQDPGDFGNRPAARASVESPSVPPAATHEVPKGFTLRFASDAVLTGLVARQVVGLYAIAPGKAHRLAVDGSKLSFWTASAPGRVHEMDASTVPADVIAAYRRTSPETLSGVRWGVSLPAAMSRQLSEYLATEEGGALIIGQDGTLSLDR